METLICIPLPTSWDSLSVCLSSPQHFQIKMFKRPNNAMFPRAKFNWVESVHCPGQLDIFAVFGRPVPPSSYFTSNFCITATKTLWKNLFDQFTLTTFSWYTEFAAKTLTVLRTLSAQHQITVCGNATILNCVSKSCLFWRALRFFLISLLLKRGKKYSH